MNILPTFCQYYNVAFDRDSVLNIFLVMIENVGMKKELLLLSSLSCQKPSTASHTNYLSQN